MYRLFVDDERYPVEDDWIIARSYEDAMWYVNNRGIPDYISFDHDLGTEKTGYDLAKSLCEVLMDTGAPMFSYYVHSQNPVGKTNIQNYLEGFMAWQKR